MKVDKKFILDVLSFISDEDNEEGYPAYKKFGSIENYKNFLEKEIQEKDYHEFLDGYNKMLSKYNMPLSEYSDEFVNELVDEESEYCNTFSLNILDEYVTNRAKIRDRKLNALLA